MTEPGPQDPYQGQPYQGQPYQGQPYQGQPYQGQPYQGQPYQGQPYQGGYPTGYPGYSGYQQQPGQPPYGYPTGFPPYVPPHAGRPGTTTASAVLAFVTAGLLILAALILATGASTLNDFSSDNTFFDANSISGELDADAVLNLLAGGLLLTGGIQLATRRRSGRTMIYAGSVITLGCSIYWLVRPTDVTPAIFWALFFATMVIITAGLALTAATRDWLAAKSEFSG